MRDLIPPVPFSFLKIAVALQGLLCFHTNCNFFCSNSLKNAIGILIRIALNLKIALGSMVTLAILILPIHEHSISFHLFLSPSISFPSTGLLSPYLDLFLFYSFDMILSEIDLNFSF